MIPLAALTGKCGKMETISPGESFNSLLSNFSEFNIRNAKLDELDKWKTHKVHETVDECNEIFIDLRWVFF